MLTPRERAVTAADEAAFAALETEVGGRPALVAVLAAADLSAEESLIVGSLADPANDGISLAKVCLGGNVSLGRLMKIFQAAALAKGQAKAIARVAEKLPDVAAGVMEDAVKGARTCGRCQGIGTVEAKQADGTKGMEECSACFGRGMVPYLPPVDIRKMALQVGGLLDKGTGNKIVIAQQQINTGAADTQQFDKLMGALDAALYGTGRDRLRTGTVVDVPAGGADGEESTEHP